MKNAVKIQALAALVLLGAGGFLAGCKSAPDLTQDQAKTMIQAKYDKDPGSVFNIAVNDTGMQQGVHANYWLGVKRYPNGYWGDFKLTPDGVEGCEAAQRRRYHPVAARRPETDPSTELHDHRGAAGLCAISRRVISATCRPSQTQGP